MRAILLDIEGTTTPLSFVQDVLFPYARARLGPFLLGSEAETVDQIAARLGAEHASEIASGERPPAWDTATRDDVVASAIAYCAWLMDRDRKSPALKQLQGLIWDRGYDAGDLHGVVYPDVPPALRRWQAEARLVAIYSSGSELAQRRLFATTADGDLTPFIARFFDTSVGAKSDSDSYVRIASALGFPAGDLCFVSDVTRELAAAREAGFAVRLCVRPGNLPQGGDEPFAQLATFDEI